MQHPLRKICHGLLATVLSWALPQAQATEGARGRPVSGTSAVTSAGIVAPEPVTVVNVAEIYMNGSISGGREVPVAGQTSLGINGKAAFSLATILKVWDTGPGAWNFASSFTLPYIWEDVTASLTTSRAARLASDRVSNLYDLYFTPFIAGYHFSETDHVALSMNIWAPTGNYDRNALASAGLNTWTFVPQLAYTHLMPSHGIEFDAVAGLQFYTRNAATDYQNAPLFTLDLLALKRFGSGFGAGIVVGTVQQLGNDQGPVADRLNGFRGRDWAIGPIMTYDTKIHGKTPLSVDVRWVPTVSSTNRLKSTQTFMATATVVF